MIIPLPYFFFFTMLSINSIKKININVKLCQKSAFQHPRLHMVHLQGVVLTLPVHCPPNPAITLTSSQASQKCSPPYPTHSPTTTQPSQRLRLQDLRAEKFAHGNPCNCCQIQEDYIHGFRCFISIHFELVPCCDFKCLSPESKVLKPEDPLFSRVEIILWPRAQELLIYCFCLCKLINIWNMHLEQYLSISALFLLQFYVCFVKQTYYSLSNLKTYFPQKIKVIL